MSLRRAIALKQSKKAKKIKRLPRLRLAMTVAAGEKLKSLKCLDYQGLEVFGQLLNRKGGDHVG
ncbi:MAG: hypothetical protein AB1638_06865 [Nitrospirota bacterium]